MCRTVATVSLIFAVASHLALGQQMGSQMGGQMSALMLSSLTPIPSDAPPSPKSENQTSTYVTIYDQQCIDTDPSSEGSGNSSSSSSSSSTSNSDSMGSQCEDNSGMQPWARSRFVIFAGAIAVSLMIGLS